MANKKGPEITAYERPPVKELHEMGEITRRAIDIAEEAAKVIMDYYRSANIQTDLKNGDAFDPVTAADRAADDLIHRKLGELYPYDLILSEENGDVPTDYSKRVWMVDPLDGTKEFLNHTDGFGIHIGLYEHGRPQFGLVFAPAIDRMFCAERGQGAYERKPDGKFKRMHTSSITDLNDARLITRTAIEGRRPLDEAVEALAVREKIADSRIKVPRIACGEAEAHLNTNFRASKWDTLAPQVILEEAGGIITDIDGDPLNYAQPSLRWERSYVAANNRKILEQILDSVRKAGS